MEDIIEFYVSCNPPLRPKGVEYVFDQLRESKIEHLEILYESTVPWFQCLATKHQRSSLVNFLTSLLHDILARETGDFELDPRAGDIEIIADDPMILSWGAFLQLGESELEEYEKYRYPSSFGHFAYKSIWQGLRSINAPQGLNVRRLLQREGDIEWSFEAFGNSVGCQMSYNTMQDILYLGSSQRASIDKAVRKLDWLLKHRIYGSSPTTHFILPPPAFLEWRLSLRPISKWRGVAISTIIRTTAVTARSDYRDLYSKGVVITYVFPDWVGDERGVLEGPLTDLSAEQTLPKKAFEAFNHYSYLAKEPITKPRVAWPPAPDCTLPKPVPQKTATVIVDWVRETRDAHGQSTQPSSTPIPQPLELTLLESGALQHRQVEKTVTSTAADLAGLSIPVSEDIGRSQGLVERGLAAGAGHSTQTSHFGLSNYGDGIKQNTRGISLNTDKANTKDLLGMEDEGDLPNLIAPMIPTLVPQPRLELQSQPRKYRQTMDQRAPRRERDQTNYGSTGRASPSPPRAGRGKSKIPIKSGLPPPGVRDDKRTAAKRSLSHAGDRAIVPAQVPPSGSQLQGSWNTGIGGEPFANATLPEMLRRSVNRRSSFEKSLEECLFSMALKAQALVGKVSMEVAFGRIVIENVHEDAINFSGVDVYEPNYSAIRLLQELATFNEANFRFHEILCLDGNNANMLKDIHWTSDPDKCWSLDGRKVFYDFNCRDLVSNCCFTIQVKADDLAYTFESQNHALVESVFIHCPDRSWDLNACLRVTDTAYFKAKYKDFAESLTESISIPDGLPCGKLRFTFEEYGEFRVSVDQVRVRHVARYRDGHRGNTVLNITMWQATNTEWDAVDDNDRGTRHIRVEPSENDDTKGLANVWYEASISSVRLEKVLEENATIEFGDEVKWAKAKLKEEGVFKNLYHPAIGMVEQMDGIGSSNNNGRNPFAGSVLSEAESKIGELKKGFW
ncbi:uncharacterized protein DNG_03655 [Cephalotrichum gorgonifer]|uniref:Uncharacterized protein n=1 Tax=Cephalotrichum gorgonifer TaxID=2041049 RepID=A0AAE8MWM9_9PEZI|nr:uncharacterized protein DNG_03655 [Cephalotrichum gorgonifer]